MDLRPMFPCPFSSGRCFGRRGSSCKWMMVGPDNQRRGQPTRYCGLLAAATRYGALIVM